MTEEWIRISSFKDKPELLEDYYVETDGCGCCQETKNSPSKEDLDIVEKTLNEQLKIISYLRNKYYVEG